MHGSVYGATCDRISHLPIQLKMEIVSNIENLEVTVKYYLAGLAAGIDILELKRL